LDLWTSPIWDLDEIEKAMFQGYAFHFELIFDLLTNPKCDFGEFEKTMFKISNGICKLFSVSGLAVNAI